MLLATPGAVTRWCSTSTSTTPAHIVQELVFGGAGGGERGSPWLGCRGGCSGGAAWLCLPGGSARVRFTPGSWRRFGEISLSRITPR